MVAKAIVGRFPKTIVLAYDHTGLVPVWSFAYFLLCYKTQGIIMITDILNEAYEAITDIINHPYKKKKYNKVQLEKITNLLNDMLQLQNELDLSLSQEKPIAQIAGCKFDTDGSVTVFVSNQEAEFYGLYFGHPGNFINIKDAPLRELETLANTLLERGVISSIDNRTYD